MKRKKWFYILGTLLLLGFLLMVYVKEAKKVNISEDSSENMQSYLEEDWKHDCYVLLQEIMAGGVRVNRYMNYLDGDKDKFFFTLLDINDDEIPELLLKYDYSWSVYAPGKACDEAYIGEIMYYNNETKYAFMSWGESPNWVSAYRYNGLELVPEYELVEEQQEIVVEKASENEISDNEDITQPDAEECEEKEVITKYILYEKNKKGKEIAKAEFDKIIDSNISEANEIKGKRLSVENITYELGVDAGLFQKEVAMAGYNSLINYYKNTGGEYADAKYALLDLYDDFPALACINDNAILLCSYYDGKLFRLEQNGFGIEERDYSYYPHKGMIRETEHELGYYKEMFFCLEDGRLKELFSAIQEPIYAFGSTNAYKKDLFGNVQYNYYINNNIVSEHKFKKQRKEFLEKYDLDNEPVSLKKDINFLDSVDMQLKIENIVETH